MSLEHSPARQGAAAPSLDRVLRLEETRRLTGLTDMQLWRMEKAGTFPRRFKLNPAGGQHGAAGHSYQEVVDWLEARKASRVA